jgi:hypothetical protein
LGPIYLGPANGDNFVRATRWYGPCVKNPAKDNSISANASLKEAGREARPGRVEGRFRPELAGVPKHGLPVAFHMLVKLDAWAGLGQDHLQRCLATLKRIMPQIVAVHLDQVEGIEEYAAVSAVVTDETRTTNVIESSFATVQPGGGDCYLVEPYERTNRRPGLWLSR